MSTGGPSAAGATFALDRACPSCDRALSDQEPTARCSRCDTLVGEGCIVVSQCRRPYCNGNDPDCGVGEELGCCRCRPAIFEGEPKGVEVVG